MALPGYGRECANSSIVSYSIKLVFSSGIMPRVAYPKQNARQEVGA